MPNPALSSEFFERLSGRREVDPTPSDPPHQWTVYRLRRQGVRLSDDRVRSTATVGLLCVLRPAGGESQATLRSPDPEQPSPLPLSNVRLVKIDRGGVLLAGLESVDSHDGQQMRRTRWQQTWWCVPVRS